MRELGLQGGATRRFQAHHDGRGGRQGAAGPARRDLSATRPNEKWVADLTYVPTGQGFCYVAFVIDCFSRMIVGWALATHVRTELLLQALTEVMLTTLAEGRLVYVGVPRRSFLQRNSKYSVSVMVPFSRLHRRHAGTMLAFELAPPRDSGTRCSRWSSRAGNCRRQ